MSLYDKLGVNRKASSAEIKDAFKEKAKKLHPDKGGDGKEMAEVNHAYLVLRDPVKRDKYDNTGQEHEDTFDTKFGSFVNMIFMKLVDMEDVEHKDMIKLFSKQCVLHKREVEKVQAKFLSQMIKCEKVLKRIGGDERIGRVVSQNVDMFKMEIAKADEEIKFMDECYEVINHHNYVFDVKEDKEESMSFSWNNFKIE